MPALAHELIDGGHLFRPHPMFVGPKARAGGDQVANNDVFFEPPQIIHRPRSGRLGQDARRFLETDRKSTRLNSSHQIISYAVFCLKKKITLQSTTDVLVEAKWLNLLGTFVNDRLRSTSHFVHGRDSHIIILKDRGLISEYAAVHPL